MSAEEDLIDYSDEELQANDAVASTANGDAKKDGLAGAGATTAKGSYAGVHAQSFEDFLLKPELIRAITDCGFEHPSEG
jgi:ATP-dependent RNA helicase UAP56/SUB2